MKSTAALRRHRELMLMYHREVVRMLLQPLTGYITTAAMLLILGVAGLFWSLEREANPHVDGFLDALYFAVATATTVGYGDIVPVTTPGKVLAIAAMLGGTAIFVGYAGVFASSVIEADRILRADRRQREREAAERASDAGGDVQ